MRRTDAQFRSGATWESSRKRVTDRWNAIHSAKGMPSIGEERYPADSHDSPCPQPQDFGLALDDWHSYEPQEDDRSVERHSGKHGDAIIWAVERGMILNPDPFVSLDGATEVKGGMEHDVFRDAPSGRMVKITQDGFFGMHSPLDFGKYIERWALSNIAFGDQVMFHGFVQLPGEPFYSVVVSQPFVEGREGIDTPQDRVAIGRFMRSRGFFADGRGGSYTNPEKNLRATDAKGANFIISDDCAFPIDLNVEALTTEPKDPNQRELFAASVRI